MGDSEQFDMNEGQFKALLDLLMVSDPWPLDEQAHRALLAYANAESGKRGYDGWIHAFHEIDRTPDVEMPHYDELPEEGDLCVTNVSYEDDVVEIDFGTKRVQYLDVPEGEISNLLSSESLIDYYRANLRGKYRYVVV